MMLIANLFFGLSLIDKNGFTVMGSHGPSMLPTLD